MGEKNVIIKWFPKYYNLLSQNKIKLSLAYIYPKMSALFPRQKMIDLIQKDGDDVDIPKIINLQLENLSDILCEGEDFYAIKNPKYSPKWTFLEDKEGAHFLLARMIPKRIIDQLA